jgi:cytochrome c553
MPSPFCALKGLVTVAAAKTLCILRLTLLIAACLDPADCSAQPGKHEDELSWDRKISGLINRYCVRCHNADQARGDVDLARDEHPRLIRQHRKTWETALTMIEDEAMPPENARQPDAEERDLLVRFLTETLGEFDCDSVDDPGKPVVRRLNRNEYDLTVLDLTGLDLKLSESFPPDASGYGFDNIGDVLTMSAVQVEQYHAAARRLVEQILQGAPNAANANAS